MHVVSRLNAKAIRIPRFLRAILKPRKLLNSGIYHLNVYRLLGRSVQGIHLGSGDLRIPSFINLDANMRADCDIVARSESLKFAPSSVGIIYGSHVFEHIERCKTAEVLRDWFRILRPGGELYLCVPDLEKLAALYLDNLSRYDTSEGREGVYLATLMILGGQVNKYDVHFGGYSFKTLSDALHQAGFSTVEHFDRSALQFASFRDAGFTSLHGTPISLNVRAVK